MPKPVANPGFLKTGERFIIAVSALILAIPCSLFAQQPELVNSKTQLEEGKRWYDSGKYELSIKEFLKIDPRDTNYVYALSELAPVYLANENYDEAIAACNKGIEKPSPYKSSLLTSLGKAYTEKKDYTKAYSTLTQAIREFPFDQGPTYALGKMYFLQKDYKNAAAYFYRTIDLNPYHSGAHFYLGRMSILRGEKVRAMMALGLYLAINNTVNSELVLLENFLNNEVTDEGTAESDGKNSFEKLDQMVRARIAMESDYKPAIPLEVAVSKQFQLLFDQWNAIDPQEGDFWMRFYVPVYDELRKTRSAEPFLYHVLASSSIEQVHRWTKKNTKALEGFYNFTNAALTQFRKTIVLPPEWGFTGPVSCWYDSDHKLESIGKKVDKNKRVGKWIYFDPNGARLAEGLFDAMGEKTGLWKYFGNDGVLKSEEDYSSGEIKVYGQQGKPSQHYFLKNKKVNGLAETFYPCGSLKERLNYEAGARQGPGKIFYPDGAIQSEYTYVRDTLEGNYINYFESGQKKSVQIYKKGKLHGPYVQYHSNGNVRSKGTYENDLGTGLWEYYYVNGVPEQKGAYKNDIATGNWTMYSIDGKLQERRNYNDLGEYSGQDTLYYNGLPYNASVYEKDKLIRITYFRQDGSESASSGHPTGTFHFKGFFPNGPLRSEGDYSSGNPQGDWKYYYRSGGLESMAHYKDGKLDGELMEYYESGKIKRTATYSDGKLNGYYKELYQSGRSKSEGWYQHGLRQQRWLTYFSDGTLESDNYYLDDELTGIAYTYSIDGKKLAEAEYVNDKTLSLTYFNEQGQIASATHSAKDSQWITVPYSTQKLSRNVELQCNDYALFERLLPDGKVLVRINYRNGDRDGKYLTGYSDGTVEGDGEYAAGKATGRWIWHHDNGNRYSEGNYLAGGRDSTWIYYYVDQKIQSKVAYRNDRRHGISQMFSPDGSIVLEKKYDEGDLTAYRTFGKDGKPDEWSGFTGEGKILASYPDGTPAYEENHSKGEYNGLKRIYYPSGKLQSEFQYQAGETNGEGRMYYPNGKIREKGSYSNDEKTGLFEYYDQDGALLRTETYRMGVLHGVTRFYQKGKVVRELKFWSGDVVE